MGIVLLSAGPLLYVIMLFGVVIPLGSFAAAKTTERSVDLMMNLVLFVLWSLGGLAGFGFLWMLVVAPWLRSGDARFTESRTPLAQSKMNRFTAWGPSVYVAGGSLVVFIEAIVNWFLTEQREPSWLLSIWLLPIVGILALHGWWFNQALQRRIRASAQRARVCFNCSYSLAEIPDCQRCPECGTQVQPNGVAT